MQKIYHFYGEIVKFQLVWTHLKLFWGQTGWGQENILRGKMPPCPPVAPPLEHVHTKLITHTHTAPAALVLCSASHILATSIHKFKEAPFLCRSMYKWVNVGNTESEILPRTQKENWVCFWSHVTSWLQAAILIVKYSPNYANCEKGHGCILKIAAYL